MAGTAEVAETVAPKSTLDDLVQVVCARVSKLGEMRKSMLMAVGVDYQKGEYILKEGDEVSLFPPVQGG
ncbi:MAG TPA: MoaD/ThiS family protein [Verrucomicrobiae bacterium]